ncbi:MAG: class I SAM-dependent methyltransferase [Pikeienuella sp.]
MANLPRDGVGAEIGVWKGDFSEGICAIANPRKLYLIDAWESFEDDAHISALYHGVGERKMNEIYQGVADRFADRIERGQIELIRAMSEQAIPMIPDGALDFVYIDADHSYEGVTRDLALIWPKMKFGGQIVLDDYRLGKWWKDGVIRAVNEFLGAHASEVRILYVMRTQICLKKRRRGKEVPAK